MNKTIRRTIAAAMLLMLTATASADTVMTSEKTRVYQNPDKGSKSISVSAGVSMEMLGEKDGWLKVEKDGTTAFILKSDVEPVKNYGGASGWLKEAAPLYKAYGSSKSHGTMPAGAKLAIYGVAGEWAQAEYQGKKGYVKLDKLSKTQISAPESPADDEDDSEDVVYFENLVAYAKSGAKVYKANSTSSKKLATLKENDTVTVDSVANGWCRVKKDGKVGFVKMTQLSLEKIGGSNAGQKEESSSPRVKEMDWWTSDIQSIFARGVVATITDVETGLSWKEVRKGGTNHADVQPCTAEDTAKLKQAYGGKWSWNRRAIIVTINGKNYAASMNGMPHGSGSISDNNFDGHHCIHFTNSRGHSSNAVCPLHQDAIKKALKAWS